MFGAVYAVVIALMLFLLYKDFYKTVAVLLVGLLGATAGVVVKKDMFLVVKKE